MGLAGVQCRSRHRVGDRYEAAARGAVLPSEYVVQTCGITRRRRSGLFDNGPLGREARYAAGLTLMATVATELESA